MVELILANLYIVFIVLMVIAFVAFLMAKGKNGSGDSLLIGAIKVAFAAAFVPNIFVFFLSAYDQSYLKCIKNLPQILTIISLIFGFYICRIFYEAFKSKA